MVYAVIDTNIFVSSFITKNETASTKKVIRSMFNGQIKPLYNDEILEEYSEVLHRSKFHLDEKRYNLVAPFHSRKRNRFRTFSFRWRYA